MLCGTGGGGLVNMIHTNYRITLDPRTVVGLFSPAECAGNHREWEHERVRVIQ